MVHTIAHEINGDTEAQRHHMISPRPHTMQVADLRFNQRSNSIQTEIIHLIYIAECLQNTNYSNMFATNKVAKVIKNELLLLH